MQLFRQFSTWAAVLGAVGLMACGPDAPQQPAAAPRPDAMAVVPPNQAPQAPVPERAFGSDTAMQVFLSLPEAAYLPPRVLRTLSEGDKLSLVARRDVANGYLVLRGTPEFGWDGTTQIGFFRLPGGAGYLAVCNITDCTLVPQCTDAFSAWERRTGAWQNVSQTLFAALTPAEIDTRWRRLGLDGPPVTRQHLGLDIAPHGLLLHCFVNFRGGSPRLASFKYEDGKLLLQ